MTKYFASLVELLVLALDVIPPPEPMVIVQVSPLNCHAPLIVESNPSTIVALAGLNSSGSVNKFLFVVDVANPSVSLSTR